MSYRVLWMQTQQSFEVNADESVLDAATRQGVDLPHDCTFGGCGTCRMKVEEGSFAYEDGELPMAMSDEEQHGACQRGQAVSPTGGVSPWSACAGTTSRPRPRNWPWTW